MPERFTQVPPQQPLSLGGGRFTPVGKPTSGGRFTPVPSQTPSLSGGPLSISGAPTTGIGGGTFSATGSTAPGIGPFGNMAGMGFGFNVGPVSAGVSPLGTMGANINFGPNTGNKGLDATINTMGNRGLSQLTGIPFSFNPLSLISSIAPVLGPVGLGLGGFNALVALANAIAQASGTMTTQQALEAVTAAPQGNQMDATMTQNAMSDAISNALAGRTVMANDPFGIAALSALGLHGAAFEGGFTPTNAAGVPLGQIAPPGPFGISSVSGTTGAQASGVPGVPGVTFSAAGGMVGPTGVAAPTAEGAAQSDPGDAAAASAAAAAAAAAAPTAGEMGIGEGAPSAPSATSASAADAATGGTTADASGGGDGGGGGDCYLASWTLAALKPEDAEEARGAFKSFFKQFMEANPKHGQKMFATYQRLASQIIQKARQAGATRPTQEYLYKNFVQPTGEYISKEELPQAVSNLTNVVRTLAGQFQIPLPGRFIPLGQ